MRFTHRGLESQLLLVVAFLEPALLLGEVQLLLLEVDDRLFGVLESGQDVVHLSHLLLGPMGLELLQLGDLKISFQSKKESVGISKFTLASKITLIDCVMSLSYDL